MFHVSKLKNRFKLRVADFNKIAEFLNNLCGGLGIRMRRPDAPSASNPPVIEIDKSELMMLFEAILSPSAPASPTELKSGDEVNTSHTDDTGTWTASTAADAKGLKILLPCRSTSRGSVGQLHWRYFTLMPDGRIYSVAAESDGTAFVAD